MFRPLRRQARISMPPFARSDGGIPSSRNRLGHRVPAPGAVWLECRRTVDPGCTTRFPTRVFKRGSGGWTSYVDMCPDCGSPVPLSPERQQLVVANIPFAYHLLHRFLRGQERRRLADDLESAALYGLVRAAAQFDPANGFRFTTAARFPIWGQLLSRAEEREYEISGLRGGEAFDWTGQADPRWSDDAWDRIDARLIWDDLRRQLPDSAGRDLHDHYGLEVRVGELAARDRCSPQRIRDRLDRARQSVRLSVRPSTGHPLGDSF